MIKKKDDGFYYEGIFGWKYSNRTMEIAIDCYLETDNGTKQVLRTMPDPDNPSKETYHETYWCADFFANEVSPKKYCYVELATNVYPLLLRLFPVTNGSSPIGGRHDTISTSFQKLTTKEQNEQAPIIARGFIAWFIIHQVRTNEQEEDYESSFDNFELEFMQGYFRDMQERYCCYLHTGRRWFGKDLTTPFEDEHLKTETEYYEQAKATLPKYLGEHHPRLVEYALEFGKDYLEFAKATIDKRRKYTAEQATTHRQGDKPTEGKEVAVSMDSNNVSPVAEAESYKKLEDAINKLSFWEKAKAKKFLEVTRGKTPTYAARHCPLLSHGEGIKVYRVWCEFNNKTPTQANYRNTFAQEMTIQK